MFFLTLPKDAPRAESRKARLKRLQREAKHLLANLDVARSVGGGWDSRRYEDSHYHALYSKAYDLVKALREHRETLDLDEAEYRMRLLQELYRDEKAKDRWPEEETAQDTDGEEDEKTTQELPTVVPDNIIQAEADANELCKGEIVMPFDPNDPHVYKQTYTPTHTYTPRFLRLGLGLSQADIAQLIGISEATISNTETGKYPVSRDVKTLWLAAINIYRHEDGKPLVDMREVVFPEVVTIKGDRKQKVA